MQISYVEDFEERQYQDAIYTADDREAIRTAIEVAFDPTEVVYQIWSHKPATYKALHTAISSGDVESAGIILTDEFENLVKREVDGRIQALRDIAAWDRHA